MLKSLGFWPDCVSLPADSFFLSDWTIFRFILKSTDHSNYVFYTALAIIEKQTVQITEVDKEQRTWTGQWAGTAPVSLHIEETLEKNHQAELLLYIWTVWEPQPHHFLLLTSLKETNHHHSVVKCVMVWCLSEEHCKFEQFCKEAPSVGEVTISGLITGHVQKQQPRQRTRSRAKFKTAFCFYRDSSDLWHLTFTTTDLNTLFYCHEYFAYIYRDSWRTGFHFSLSESRYEKLILFTRVLCNVIDDKIKNNELKRFTSNFLNNNYFYYAILI